MVLDLNYASVIYSEKSSLVYIFVSVIAVDFVMVNPFAADPVNALHFAILV